MTEQLTDLVDFKQEWYKTATEAERKQFRDWLLSVLRMHENVEITFVKVDGTVREMKCTLKEHITPKVDSPKESDSLCVVWDQVMNNWRSFKFENIRQINFSI
jgi:predicted DNA-binding transcriptional regulator YafY